MSLRASHPQLANLLASWFAEADLDGLDDEALVQRYALTADAAERAAVRAQARDLAGAAELPLTSLTRLANRRFASPEQARTWLNELAARLERIT